MNSSRRCAPLSAGVSGALLLGIASGGLLHCGSDSGTGRSVGSPGGGAATIGGANAGGAPAAGSGSADASGSVSASGALRDATSLPPWPFRRKIQPP